MINMGSTLLKFMFLRVFILITVVTGIVMAETNYEIISDIGSSARMLRLGNVEGFSNSSIALFENPANLQTINDYSFDLFTTTFMGEVKYYAYSYAKKTSYGNVAIGFMSKGIDDVAHTFATDQNRFLPEYYYKYSNSIFSVALQNKLSFFTDYVYKRKDVSYIVTDDTTVYLTPSDNAVLKSVSKRTIFHVDQTVTENSNYLPVITSSGNAKITAYVKKDQLKKKAHYSDYFKNISSGISLKYFKHSNDTVIGKSWNADLGFTYSKNKIDYSLSLKNILFFSKINYNNGGKERVPMHLSFAIKYPHEYADLFVQLKYLRNRFLWSLAASYSPNDFPYLDFSLGYKPYFVLNKVHYNFVFGFGVLFNDLSFNYAQEFSANEYFNNKHYFSISLNR